MTDQLGDPLGDRGISGTAICEFTSRRDGMIFAMEGGLWLHRHVWCGTPMAHLVSTNRERLLDYGRFAGLPSHRLQFKALKDPRTGLRQHAWHWDLVGPFLPPRREPVACPPVPSEAERKGG